MEDGSYYKHLGKNYITLGPQTVLFWGNKNLALIEGVLFEIVVKRALIETALFEIQRLEKSTIMQEFWTLDVSLWGLIEGALSKDLV